MSIISFEDVLETINMIKEENLDIRTITMGISLYDCAGDNIDVVCDRIYSKIPTTARDLVKVGCDIEKIKDAPLKVAKRYFCEKEVSFLEKNPMIPKKRNAI